MTTGTAATLTATPKRSNRGLWRSLSRSRPAMVGLVFLIAFLIIAIAAPILAPHDPATPHLLYRLAPPAWLAAGSTEFLLGTDHLGRDILSRILHGSRIALLVAFGAVAISAFIGVTLGLLAGYFRGWTETIIMRIVDTIISIPNVLLYLAVLGVFGPSLPTLVLVIGLVNWTTFARVVRGEVLSVRRREFVESAVASGQSTFLIVLRHVLPSTVAPIIVVATLNVAVVIVLEASLSFLGLGVQPPTVTWGRMLADGRNYLTTSWCVATFPGIAITVLCLSLILVGDWLRDFFDPRTR